MLIVWAGLLAVFIFSAQTIGQSPDSSLRSIHNVDIHNGTALQEYAASLRRLFVQKGGSRSMPGMSPNSLAGRLRNPFEGLELEPRQDCTCETCTDNKNYCFPADSESYCSNCGVCCVADKSYCCNFATAVCCPGDTDGCCEAYQTCDTGVGCRDPTKTISTTITSWVTNQGTSTIYATRGSTTTVYTTEVEFVTRTVSNVDIATQVQYTTITPGAKVRRGNTDDGIFPTSTSSGYDAGNGADIQSSPTHAVSAAQAPIVTVLAHADFDVMAHRLEHIGVIVKRQSTITSTLTFTVTATTQVNSVVTSTIASVSSILSTIHTTITSTVYRNAASTVQVTSTFTAPRPPASIPSAPASTATDDGNESDSPNDVDSDAAAASSTETGSSSSSSSNSGGNGGDGLSSGAFAGIGVGAATGAALLCALLFFLWRRHRKAQQNNSPTAGAAAGGAFSDKESSPYSHTTSPPQRQSYLSDMNTMSMSTHSYQAVPPSEASVMTGATGRPAEMPDNRGFGYAPYELYDESGYEQDQDEGQDQDQRHEMYTRGEFGRTR